MFNTILICLTVFLTGLIVLLGLKILVARQKQSLKSTLQDYFEPKTEGGSSEFAELVNVISTLFAEKTSQSLKATFMGIQSADVRQEQAITGDIVEGLANEQNPLIGVLLDRFPALKKRVAKNPALLGMIGEVGGKLLGRSATLAGSPGGNNKKGEFEFKL